MSRDLEFRVGHFESVDYRHQVATFRGPAKVRVIRFLSGVPSKHTPRPCSNQGPPVAPTLQNSRL